MAESPTQPDFQLELPNALKLKSWVLAATNKWSEAEEVFREGAKILEKRLRYFPFDYPTRHQLAEHYSQTAAICRRAGRDELARELVNRALPERLHLMDQWKNMPNHREGLADTHREDGELRLRSGQVPEALQAFGEARSCYQKLADDYPEVRIWREKAEETRVQIERLPPAAPLGTAPR